MLQERTRRNIAGARCVFFAPCSATTIDVVSSWSPTQPTQAHLGWHRERNFFAEKQSFSSKPEKYYFVESVTNDVKNWLTMRVSPLSNQRD